MSWEYTTWPEMYGNGAKIGKVTILQALKTTPEVPVVEKIECFVGDVGTQKNEFVAINSDMDPTQGFERALQDFDLHQDTKEWNR